MLIPFFLLSLPLSVPLSLSLLSFLFLCVVSNEMWATKCGNYNKESKIVSHYVILIKWPISFNLNLPSSTVKRKTCLVLASQLTLVCIWSCKFLPPAWTYNRLLRLQSVTSQPQRRVFYSIANWMQKISSSHERSWAVENTSHQTSHENWVCSVIAAPKLHCVGLAWWHMHQLFWQVHTDVTETRWIYFAQLCAFDAQHSVQSL